MVFTRSNIFIVIAFVLELLAVLIAAGVNIDNISSDVFGFGGLAAYFLAALVP